MLLSACASEANHSLAGTESDARRQALDEPAPRGEEPAMIIVCPLSRIEETVAASGCRRMVTLINAGTLVVRPAGLIAADHLRLSMHDIVEELPDMTPPGEHHV